MNITNEIRRAINYINASAPIDSKLGDIQIDALLNKVIYDFENDNYDFSSYDSITLKQGEKKRPVKLYKLFSTENILCQVIKYILDRTYKIKYPNRNKVMHRLFDIFKSVKQMSEFTILKFDFKDYFNSVSSVYVYEKHIKRKMVDRLESKMISVFVNQTQYSYAGLSTSNLFAEIIALDFDKLIQEAFSNHGLLFCERYIDDTIIVLNQHLEQSICEKILENALNLVYHDSSVSAAISCKTKYNPSKFKMITRRSLKVSPSTIDFLGYEFFFFVNIDSKKPKEKIVMQYGISIEKMAKYDNRIDEIIKEFKTNNDIELLRHRILAFASRTVYVNKKFHKNIWKVKGFINNYGELRYLLNTPFLHQDTENYLKNMIETAFTRNELDLPCFLINTNNQKGYNLMKNMETNKTLLFVEHIGFDKVGLKKKCTQIGIDSNNKSYGSLVREYLIKTKVGY